MICGAFPLALMNGAIIIINIYNSTGMEKEDLYEFIYKNINKNVKKQAQKFKK